MLHVDNIPRRWRAIVAPTLGDPALDQLHLTSRQRLLAARHRRWFPHSTGNLGDNQAFADLSGHDPRLVVIALLEQVGVASHDQAAFGLGRLVAALAVLLENGAD